MADFKDGFDLKTDLIHGIGASWRDWQRDHTRSGHTWLIFKFNRE